MNENIPIIAGLLCDRFRRGGKLLICGNGGSSADASHIAAEFVGRFTSAHHTRRPLPAIALNDAAMLTAIANDFGFEHVFRRQVEAYSRAGDVLFVLSTSGKSSNVLQAARYASQSCLHVVAFTGLGATDLIALSDHAVVIYSDNTVKVQEGCMAAAHEICRLVDDAFHVKGPA